MVVDTPGLNDPCKARSDVTLNWVGKTDAMIYIFNTKQAFTKQDVEFLDEYCSHIMPEKIILVLGQSDRANFQEVQEYITNLINSEDFRKRGYLKKQKPYPISVMAAMLRNHPEKVKYADFYREKITPELIEEEGYMPALEEAINSSLMASKGQSVLVSHRNKIYSILRDTINHIEDEIARYNDRLDNYGKTKEEIEQKRKSVEKLAFSIQQESERFEKEFDRKKTEIVKNFITEKFERERQDTRKSYETQCHHYWKTFDICLANTPVFFREKIKNTVNSVLYDDCMTQFRDQINDICKDTHNQLKRQIDDYDLTFREFKTPILNLQLVHDRIDEMVNEVLQREKLQNQRKKILLLFTNQGKSIQNLIGEVDKAIADLYKDTRETTMNELERDIVAQVDKYFSNMRNFQEGVKGNLDDINYDLAEQHKEIEKIKGVIHDRKINIQQVQALQNEISAKLSKTFGG